MGALKGKVPRWEGKRDFEGCLWLEQQGLSLPVLSLIWHTSLWGCGWKAAPLSLTLSAIAHTLDLQNLPVITLRMFHPMSYPAHVPQLSPFICILQFYDMACFSASLFTDNDVLANPLTAFRGAPSYNSMCNVDDSLPLWMQVPEWYLLFSLLYVEFKMSSTGTHWDSTTDWH